MKKILVGIATHEPIVEFRRDIFPFLEACSLKHKLSEHWVRGKSLIDAQTEITDIFLETDNEYLLFIEDDHWGFTLPMLDALLDSGKQMIGIPYYSRHAPYYLTAMRKRRVGEYIPEPHKSGTHAVDLIGFGFTLIHRSSFESIERPFFKTVLEGSKATDRWLCDRLIEKGISPYACFDYLLPHRDITKDNVLDKKKKWFEAYRRKVPYGYKCNVRHDEIRVLPLMHS